MQKRRERIEKWRAERKKNTELLPINLAQPAKKWSLEDDDDDDDEPLSSEGKDGEGDEVDPLDAYMQCVNEEVGSKQTPKVVNKGNVS